MKKFMILSASLLCLTACSFNFNYNDYKNTAPTNIRIDLAIGSSNKENGIIEVVDNDVLINASKKDSYDNSYFAHFNNGSYIYYQKDALNNSEWKDFTVETADKENMTTLDAINSLVGTISNFYYDIFDVEVVNPVKSSGTEVVLNIENSVYKVGSKKYCYFDGINTFFKITDEAEKEQTCEITFYQYTRHFTDSPNF